jgi:hypothetical protein
MLTLQWQRFAKKVMPHAAALRLFRTEPEILASASASKPSKTAIASDDRYCDRTLSVDINRRHDIVWG